MVPRSFVKVLWRNPHQNKGCGDRGERNPGKPSCATEHGSVSTHHRIPLGVNLGARVDLDVGISTGITLGSLHWSLSLMLAQA